jgi:uncharacterized membrane-anchored protein YjiN (DUF445 family)
MNLTVDQENKDKERGLINMKRNALILLGIAVILFGIALFFDIGILKAFSEAAMVGGIADWFAVVALFRHPLGIPIPHTALIPKNKDSIGVNLGNFVSEEFLTREKLEVKLEQFNFATKASDWLSEKENATKVANLIVVNLIPGILKTINDDDVKRFIHFQFKEKLGAINFGEWIAIGLEPLNKSGLQEQLFTSVLEILCNELVIHKDLIHEKVKNSTPFLTFGLADNRISEGIFNGLYEFLNDAKQPDSAIREKLNHYIHDFLDKLKNSEEMKSKVNNLIIGFTNKKEVQDYINGIWEEIKQSITNDLAKHDESTIKISLTNMIQGFGEGIKEDHLMIDKINNFIKNDLLEVVLNNKKMIGDLISSTVKSWNTDEVSKKLELEIGEDLQYIRINGTLVGGLVGLFIYSIEWVYLHYVL